MTAVFAIYYDPDYVAWSFSRLGGMWVWWIEAWRFAIKIGVRT